MGRISEQAKRTPEAEVLRRIADQPTALWVTGDPAAVEQQVRARMAATAATPILVAYNIPGRDCGNCSAGGAADAATYRTWVTNLARGVGDGRAVVILEPDALAHLIAGDCLSGAQAQERYALLQEAISTLRAKPRTAVYLDAGNPSWITDTAAVATALQRAGAREAIGFALNVANFNTTDITVSYGRVLASALGEARFIIDTSRNGRGPYPDPQVNGAPSWCNPRGAPSAPRRPRRLVGGEWTRCSGSRSRATPMATAVPVNPLPDSGGPNTPWISPARQLTERQVRCSFPATPVVVTRSQCSTHSHSCITMHPTPLRARHQTAVEPALYTQYTDKKRDTQNGYRDR